MKIDFLKKIPSKITVFLMYSEKFNGTLAIALLAIALCFCLQWCMLGKVPDKLAFFIDGFSYKTTKLTVGKGSDIAFDNVPKDYLTIERCDSGFTWAVNPVYKDSLQYFKIGQDNPNATKIINDDSQKISISLASNRDASQTTLDLSGKDIYDEWDKHFSEQQNVLLRHFAVHYLVTHRGYNACDSLGYLQQKQLRSMLSRKKGDITLVVLDENTQVDDSSYCRHGVVTGDRIKVQFFRVTDYCYLDDDDDNSFRVNDVNYVAKPSVKLTKWGAGHAMIKASDDSLIVSYPRAIGYVESIDTLRTMASKISGLITLKQEGASVPTKTDIYMPQLSGLLSTDICNIDFNYNKIHIKSNNKDSIEVVSSKHLVPTLMPVDLTNGYGKLHCRTGIIDGAFIWSYLWLPMATAILLIILTVGPFSCLIASKNKRQKIIDYNRIKPYPLYVVLLILLALAFCVGKSMIALKLSYSYPYFEKMTGIIPASTALMILLFYTIALLLNIPFIKTLSQHNNSQRSIWVSWATIAAAFAALIYAFFNVLDPAVNATVISSYFPNEIYTEFRLLNPKTWVNWVNSVGINDTHRSVVYALIVIEALVLAALAIAYACWDRILALCKSISDKATNTRHKWCAFIADNIWAGVENWALTLIKKASKGKFCIELPQKSCEDPQTSYSLKRWIGTLLGRLPLAIVLSIALLVVMPLFGFNKVFLILGFAFVLLIALFKTTYIAFVYSLRTLFPWHIALLLVIALLGALLGNFGTAFITAAVILGLCKALRSVEFDNPNTPDIQEGLQPLEVLWQMLFISIAYIIAAMYADNGYMTNYLGFFVAFLCFFFLMKIPGWQDILSQRIDNNTRRWTSAYLVVLLALIILLPNICSNMFDPNDVHYERFARRVMLYSNFNDLQDAGYRYTETDAEFMVVMSHYMQHRDGGDPLSNDKHMMHASVSSGQSPVVLNDLSMPIAFFGSYGTTLTSILFFLLLATLLFVVMRFSLNLGSRSNYAIREAELKEHFMWRILAVSLWVGTSLYLYLSYIGRLPFTGRLVPGFGVDAVGEALESAILLAFMAAITIQPSQFGKVSQSNESNSKNDNTIYI